MTVGGQRSCCSQWGLSDPQILPPAEANPDPLGDLAGLPVDYSCRNPLQFTAILLWHRENHELPGRELQRRANFYCILGEGGEGQLPKDAAPAPPTQCSPLRGSGQGGCLLQEPKAMSPQHRSQTCSCKGITGTPEDPSQLFPGMGEKVEKRGRDFVCPGTPVSGSSQSSEKSLREGCLSWVKVSPSGSSLALVQNKQLVISPCWVESNSRQEFSGVLGSAQSWLHPHLCLSALVLTFSGGGVYSLILYLYKKPRLFMGPFH